MQACAQDDPFYVMRVGEAIQETENLGKAERVLRNGVKVSKEEGDYVEE